MEQGLERLVVRSREGDTDAFALIVERFQRRVFYTILKVVRDRHLADDLTQEVFLAVYHKLDTVKDCSSFVSWIHRIAFNKAIDFKRRASRERERVFLVEDFRSVRLNDTSSPVRGATEHREEKERFKLLETAMREAVDALPDGQQAVLLLSMDKKLSLEEIAKILKIPRGTVKSRLHHARKFMSVKLRSLLEGMRISGM